MWAVEMATGGIDSKFLERSILCSKEYITDEHITLPHGKRYLFRKPFKL